MHPAIASDLLKGDETVVTLFLVLFTVGIAIGSMLTAFAWLRKIVNIEV